VSADIAVDDRVEFSFASSRLTGTVLRIAPSIGNGQPFAIIELDNMPPTCVQVVPLSDLTKLKVPA